MDIKVKKSGLMSLKLARAGFTIVELLIVIVVIGILAAISIVSYTGIQNRASDTSVKSDLSSLRKSFEVYRQSNVSDSYPISALGLGNTNPDFTFPVSKSAYDASATGYNLLNCTVSGANQFGLLAKSKSGKFFAVGSSLDVKEVTGIALLSTNDCGVIFPGFSASGAGYSSGAWRVWTDK